MARTLFPGWNGLHPAPRLFPERDWDGKGDKCGGNVDDADVDSTGLGDEDGSGGSAGIPVEEDKDDIEAMISWDGKGGKCGGNVDDTDV